MLFRDALPGYYDVKMAPRNYRRFRYLWARATPTRRRWVVAFWVSFLLLFLLIILAHV